jgi:CRISPR-associated protein Cmr1
MKLITPMYGGGVKPGTYDSDFLIRPTSVRGQLRFWWRATRGAKFNTPEELHKEESKIWGSTEIPSSTIVKVNSQHWEHRRLCVENYGFERNGPEVYVLFPAAADTNQHDLVKEGLSFALEVSFESLYKKDVECAIWAWANFGGIGARTRRGCGALYCHDLALEGKAPEFVKDSLLAKTRDYELRLNAERDWPTFCEKILLKSVANANGEVFLDAWRDSIRPMKDFRQGRDFARNPGSGSTPGRSRWPEPDTLRNTLGSPSRPKYAPGHAPDPRMPIGFPRAAFGLPIIFKFKNEREGDPSGNLYPYGMKRMGSPIILRPIAILAPNGRAIPMSMVLCLKTKLPELLTLEGSATSFSKDEHIINKKFNGYPDDAPMYDRSTSGSAIEAFIAYLKETEQGFHDIY